MQFVKTADLRPGMRLAKPIYNKMGVLLYERDTKLTLQGINSIENFGLIGIFILEPAEPLPPISKEDIEFEQLQTIYMFKLKENMDKLQKNNAPDTLLDLVVNIQSHYGVLKHKVNFAQTLRSSADFVYKHAVSVAILTAMISNRLHIGPQERIALITASLLYDFGYLYVPHAILDKGEDIEQGDKDFIQMNLERGYETLRPCYEESNLPALSLEIIQQMIFANSKRQPVKAPSAGHKLLHDILKTADKFDRLTAMNIKKAPMSEIAAISYLRSRKVNYNPKVVAALAECIHILPTGSCVDLSDGEKALVLVENPADFSHPMVLKFSNNVIYDLSDPAIAKNLQVTDIMKTMDNRIAIDEKTIQQFSSDRYVKETTDRFLKKKLEIASKKHRTGSNKTTDSSAAVKVPGGKVQNAAQTISNTEVSSVPQKELNQEISNTSQKALVGESSVLPPNAADIPSESSPAAAPSKRLKLR